MTKRRLIFLVAGGLVLAILAGVAYQLLQPRRVTVGSKAFTESVILGEAVAHLVRETGQEPRHRSSMGGTQVLWRGLVNGSIDVYPEYTGTIAQEILGGVSPEPDSLREKLAAHGVVMTRPLGFANTFALGMTEQKAQELKVETISDLANPKLKDLRVGVSNEFLKRKDGWEPLKARYDLPQSAKGLDHDVAIKGLRTNRLDVTDLYSTDADILAYELRVLKDDMGYFPEYHAVLLYRADLEQKHPEVVEAIKRLEGAIKPDEMVLMNTRVALKRASEKRTAGEFLNAKLGTDIEVVDDTWLGLLLQTTWEHIQLVTMSLVAAILVAVPLGVLAAKQPKVGQVILAVVGVIQTIPSLAVLVFMIPLLGLGTWPVVVALFLYSLLPIVRNTFTGLRDIPPNLRESTLVLGLPAWARLWLVELPIASPSILGGIKTAAVINVGTATIGALIGAGGYGQAIFTGIRLDDFNLTLQGAIPAAVMALVVQALFELAEENLVSPGLRLKAA